MSEMTTNGTSDDTLIRDSQLTGFHLFKERIGSCCCRIFKKSSNYNLSSVSKDIEQQEDKPSYVNQAFQKDKKQRKDKLEQIAKSLPKTSNIQPSSSNNQIPRAGLTPSSNLFQPKTPLSTINNRQVKDETSTDDSTEEEEEEEEESSSDSSDSSNNRTKKPANKKR